jgi:hypothetical protein
VRRTVLGLLAALLVAVPSTSAGADTPKLTCTVSKPAFANPFGRFADDDGVTALEMRQHGTWIGFAFDGLGDYDVLTWRSGQPVNVLSTFRYRDMGTAPYGRTTIDAAGITPAGAVVAGVLSNVHHGLKSVGMIGYFWSHGQRHRLPASRGWFSVLPQVVTPEGHVLGYSVSGTERHPIYHLVRWAGVHARARVVFTLPLGATPPVVDTAGDIAWTGADGLARARMASGVVRELRTEGNNLWVYPSLSGGTYVFAEANRGLVRWNLGVAGPDDTALMAEPVKASRDPWAYPDAADSAGAVVSGNKRRFVYFPNFERVRIPREDTMDGPVDEVIVGHAVAFTAKDRLVRFLRCGS